jgi:hypothetical protein
VQPHCTCSRNLSFAEILIKQLAVKMESFVLCEKSEKNLETILRVNNTAKILFKICQLMDNWLVS